jgi:hypothetical protein
MREPYHTLWRALRGSVTVKTVPSAGRTGEGSASLRRMMLPIVAILAAAVPAPGSNAPAFSLDASTGKKISLADFKGQTLVLAFFPKAFTGG